MSERSEYFKAYNVPLQAKSERATTNASWENLSAKYSISVDETRGAYKQWWLKKIALYSKSLDEIHFELRKIALCVKRSSGPLIMEAAQYYEETNGRLYKQGLAELTHHYISMLLATISEQFGFKNGSPSRCWV